MTDVVTIPKRRYTELRCAVGAAAQTAGDREIEDRFGVTRGFVRYWRARFADPTLHAGGHGGARINSSVFSDEGQKAAESLLWTLLKAEPMQTQQQMQRLLSDYFQVNVTLSWIGRVLKSWRWSRKGTEQKAIMKYTAENIAYYGEYIHSIVDVPLVNLKYLDEAHFDWRTLRPRKGYSARGRRVHTVRNTTSGPRSYSVTMMTSLTCERGFAVSDPRVDVNTSWDFLEFVLQQIIDGRLVHGDVLVCDNASIHNAGATLGILNEIFTARGMRLIFLPKYSPELNPCELIWAQMKLYIRSHIHITPSLLVAIALSCITITWDDVVGYYRHCLYHF